MRLPTTKNTLDAICARYNDAAMAINSAWRATSDRHTIGGEWSVTLETGNRDHERYGFETEEQAIAFVAERIEQMPSPRPIDASALPYQQWVH